MLCKSQITFSSVFAYRKCLQFLFIPANNPQIITHEDRKANVEVKEISTDATNPLFAFVGFSWKKCRDCIFFQSHYPSGEEKSTVLCFPHKFKQLLRNCHSHLPEILRVGIKTYVNTARRMDFRL